MDLFQSIRKVNLHTTDDIPASGTTYARRKRHSYAGTGDATFGSKEKTKRVRSVGCLEQQNQTSLLQFMAPLKRKSLESVTASRMAHNSASAGLSSRDPSSGSRDPISLSEVVTNFSKKKKKGPQSCGTSLTKHPLCTAAGSPWR